MRDDRESTNFEDHKANLSTLNRFLPHIQRSGFLLPAALTGMLWLKGLHPQLPGLSCPLRALTGIPSPTCFLTRATSAALTGDLHHALHLHLFGPVVAAVLVGWSVLSIRQRRLMPRGVLLRAAARPTIALSTGALLTYWLLRLSLNAWPSSL